MQVVLSRSALALGVALSLSAQAQRAQQPEVVVTAHRAPTTVDETLASVTVITRSQIEASATFDLVDLLRAVPGLDIVRGGGDGAQTSVFLRGTNSNHALVLIDGVRVSSLGTGAFAWEHLALSQIERVEVVRGPRAALWGSDAIGGVIQIFTRRVRGYDLALSAGNHATYGGDAGLGLRNDQGSFDVRLGYVDARGINAQNPQGFAFDPDDDGYTRTHALVHGDYQLGEQRLDAMASLRDNDIEFDQGKSTTRQAQSAFGLEGVLGEAWSHRAQVSAVRDTLITPDFFSRFESRREQFDWTHSLGLAERNELLFGLAYVRERGKNLDTFSDEAIFAKRRHNQAGFAAWRVGAGAHDFEASGRYDDNSQFGGESTFSAAWGWQAAEAVRTTLSYGEGFRAPTLNELYSPGFGGLFAGNPALDPERSRSVEAGAKFVLTPSATLGVSLYRNDVRDLISFSGGQTFQAININRARIDGVEVESNWTLGPWAVNANATWQDAENRDTGAPLLRRPDRKGSLLVERSFDNGARFGVEGYAASSRPDFGGDLGGYSLVSLRGRWPLGEELALDARIENVFDRNYELVHGFNTPGMTALLTLRWNPNP